MSRYSVAVIGGGPAGLVAAIEGDTVRLSATAQNAVDMFEMKTGLQFQAGTSLSSLMPRFLKSMPQDPTGTSSFAAWSGEGLGAGAPVGMVVLPMSRNADAICTGIVQQTSGGTAYVTVSSVGQLPTQPVGCFRAGANINSFVAQTYYAYVRT